MHRLLLASALLAIGCTSSHTAGDGGTPPGTLVCHPVVEFVPGTCCNEATREPASVDGVWFCPATTVDERSCTGYLERGECDGFVIDAGVPADWGACSVTSECVLSANTCCGQCGIPTLEGMDGVNASYTAQHYAEVCPVPEPCPDCPTGINPELFATCAAGRCVAMDLGRDAITQCNTDLDCRIRVPDCCACGADTSPFRLIALRADQLGAYSTLVCDPDTGCPECEPTYPAEVSAVCGADGHCEVRIAGP